MRNRTEIEQKYKWRLEDMYEDVKAWENDLAKAEKLCCEMDRYNTIDDIASCKKIIQLQEDILMTTEKLYVYARMRRDEDNSNALAQGLADRATSMFTKALSSLAFITPAIIALGEEKMMEWCKDEALAIYVWSFQETFRQAQHTLAPSEEKLLAMSGEAAGSAQQIFGMFNNADLRFDSIKDENGEMTEVTKGNFTTFLESNDRRVREEAFKTLYSRYKEFNNTLSAAQIANLKKDIFYTQARKYDSCISKYLDSDNVPAKVYDGLIDTVRSRLPLLHRYLELRKKVLGVEELHMWDLYVPLVEESNENTPYEDAVDSVLNGLSVLGENYVNILKEGFSGGWIDVYENRGKTSGAYSWGEYGTHPYVLLNYQGRLNDIFTIAHEMGHALHSYLSNKKQPYVYSEYKIFVAEVASTVNEILLMKSMLKNAKDDQTKAYLLNHYLEEFRGTVFRQTMFAEYERDVHRIAESGDALTAESINSMYYTLNKDYFGGEVVIDEEIQYEWSRIPHFYNSFYVYKYATGFSAASAIAKMILEEGQSAVDRYMEFLSGGGSDYPLELLKKAGVDLTVPKPVEDALQIFDETLKELETIIG